MRLACEHVYRGLLIDVGWPSLLWTASFPRQLNNMRKEEAS